MERRMKDGKIDALSIREKIALAVKLRIAVMRPHKEAARRAAAFLTLPMHAALGAKLLYRASDSVWRAIGDTSTDFNFYTKRGILSGLLSATMFRWFNDTSENDKATMDFLQARIENVMQMETLKSKMREAAKKLPSLSEILKPTAARR
jgi:ubiquinone biosynthesis protein COQ9